MNANQLTTWRLRCGLSAGIPGRQGPPKGDLSASKVRVLDKCDLAYSLGKIERLDERPTEAMLRGSLCHRVLESVGRARLSGVRSGKPGLNELRESHRTESAKFRCSTAVMSQAWDILESLADRLDFSNTIAIEENFKFELPQDALAGAPFTVVGAFDRLDAYEDPSIGNVIHIHDYKSGSNALSVSELIDDVQAQFYVAAVAQHWKGPIRLTFYYLGADLPVTFLAPPDMATKGVDVAMVKMAEIRNKRDWKPNTGPHCVACDFRTACPGYGAMAKCETKVFPVESDEDLLKEYVRCRSLAKMFDDHKKVCGDALKYKLDQRDRVIGGGLRAQMVAYPKKQLPDDLDRVVPALASASGIPEEEIRNEISGVCESRLKRFINKFTGEVRDRLEKALDEIKEIFDVTAKLDVRALPGGF